MRTKKTETKKQPKPEAQEPEQTGRKAPTDEGLASAASALNDLFNVIIGGERRQAAPERNPVDDQIKALAKSLSATFSSDGSPVKIRIGVAQPKPVSEIEDLKPEAPEHGDLMDEDAPYSRLAEALRQPKGLTPIETLRDMASANVEMLNATQIPEFERILVHLKGSVQYDLYDAIQSYGEELRSLRRAAEKLLAALDVDEAVRAEDDADMKDGAGD